VVSDSNGVPDQAQICRDEYLAHELGHNMGQQHDIATAAGDDDSNLDGSLLDPEEYGRTAYSFGYNAAVAQGDFYTIMALRRNGQSGFVVFANPNLTCGTSPCGIAASSDNARSINEAMPIVARFRVPRSPTGGNWLRGDLNGDGRADVIWRNTTTFRNAVWLSGLSTTAQSMFSVTNNAWSIQGVGDFDNDGQGRRAVAQHHHGPEHDLARGQCHDADLRQFARRVVSRWRAPATSTATAARTSTGATRSPGSDALWKGGSSANGQSLSSVALDWQPVGVGDFNRDGRDDILWRNTSRAAT
jgi:hypothetical protein